MMAAGMAVVRRPDGPGQWDFAELRPETRMLIVGLAGFIGIVTLVTAGAIVAIEMSGAGAPIWLGGPTRAVADRPVGGGFESISERPLFSRDRRKVLPPPVMAVETPPPVSVVVDRNLVLKGVFMDGGAAKAFLIATQNPLGIWVQVHDSISGWRVVEIQPDRVLFDNLTETLMVQLSVNGQTR